MSILFIVLFVDYSQLPRVHLRLIFLFFDIFLFLNLLFLGNQIQTEKVLVPTDEIVDSPTKLLATKKTLTVGQGGLMLIKEAPERSFLRRLSSKEIFEISLKTVEKMKSNIDRYVALGDEIGLSQLISLLSRHAHHIGAVAFHKQTVYYEVLLGLKIRRNLEFERKSFINAG